MSENINKMIKNLDINSQKKENSKLDSTTEYVEYTECIYKI